MSETIVTLEQNGVEVYRDFAGPCKNPTFLWVGGKAPLDLEQTVTVKVNGHVMGHARFNPGKEGKATNAVVRGSMAVAGNITVVSPKDADGKPKFDRSTTGVKRCQIGLKVAHGIRAA